MKEKKDGWNLSNGEILLVGIVWVLIIGFELLYLLNNYSNKFGKCSQLSMDAEVAEITNAKDAKQKVSTYKQECVAIKT